MFSRRVSRRQTQLAASLRALASSALPARDDVRLTDRRRNEIADRDDLREIDAGLDAEAVHQIQHVLGRDVAGRALRIRTAAESRHRRVINLDAFLQRRVDVGERLAVGVVEVARQTLARKHLRRPPPNTSRVRFGVPTPIVSAISISSQPSAAKRCDHIHHRRHRHLALIRAAERARHAAANRAGRAPSRPCATGANRSMLSAMLQLMFFCENASLAAPKITISSAFASSAPSKPRRFGVSTE